MTEYVPKALSFDDISARTGLLVTTGNCEYHRLHQEVHQQQSRSVVSMLGRPAAPPVPQPLNPIRSLSGGKASESIADQLAWSSPGSSTGTVGSLLTSHTRSSSAQNRPRVPHTPKHETLHPYVTTGLQVVPGILPESAVADGFQTCQAQPCMA